MYDKDTIIILSMLEVVNKIENYTENQQSAENFYENNRDFDATMMNFIILGEAVSKLSTNFKNNNKNIDWYNISGFRNILAHNYFGVNVDITWQIIQDKIPILKQELQKIIK